MSYSWALSALLCLGFSTLWAQDPVKVAPNQCKVEFENNEVRVLRWNEPANAKSPMHQHPAMVSIALTSGRTRFTLPDGKTQEETVKPGQVTWSGPEKHASQDISGKPSELIQVELKGGVANAKPYGGANADPVKVDAKHYKVELENDRVRVLRISYGPKEKSVMHYHPDSVAIYLTGGSARMTTPDGRSQESSMKPGAAVWTPAGNHLPQSTSAKPFELILVELKK